MRRKPIAVYGAIAANLAVAVSKFIVAAITGSSAMLSEGIHSVVDTGNQLLLLLGLRQSQRPPDHKHPFGYGQALYFWGLIVAVLLFGVGGGMSFYEGISHLQHPSEFENAIWSYVVLGLALVFEGISWTIAYRELSHNQRGQSLWQLFRESKNPSTFTVLIEDSAAILGLLVAALGIFLSQLTNKPLYDGAASMVIGVILVVAAILLIRESGGLLIGESASSEVVRAVREIAAGDAAVQ